MGHGRSLEGAVSPCSAQGEHVRAEVPRVGSGVRGAGWNPSLVISASCFISLGFPFLSCKMGIHSASPWGYGEREHNTQEEMSREPGVQRVMDNASCCYHHVLGDTHSCFACHHLYTGCPNRQEQPGTHGQAGIFPVVTCSKN